jgi:hypothetical protein
MQDKESLDFKSLINMDWVVQTLILFECQLKLN